MVDLLLLLALFVIAVWVDRSIRRHSEGSGSLLRPAGALTPQVDEYLDRVDSGLELPARDRGEIRSELLFHLIDSTAGIQAEGLDEEHAAREAMARLGNPAELAKAMNEAHRSTRRLLAGAAGGIFEAGVGAAAGIVIGWILVFVVMIAATLLLATILRPLTDLLARAVPAFNSDQDAVGLNTAMAAAVAAFAAVVAARRAVRTTHYLSRWSISTVGRWWALAGGGVLACLVLFVVRGQQTLLTVPVELLIPVGFVMGAIVKADKPFATRVPRPVMALAVIAAFVTPVAMVLATAGGGVTSGGYSYNIADQQRAWDRVAPSPNGDGYPGLGVDRISGQGSPVVQMTLTFEDPAVLDAYRDLRFEAWRAVHYPEAPAEAVEAMIPDPAYSAPYETEQAIPYQGSVSLQMDLGRVRTTSWLVFLTGIGSDGHRYRLAWPQSFISSFDGTVWDWLRAGN